MTELLVNPRSRLLEPLLGPGDVRDVMADYSSVSGLFAYQNPIDSGEYQVISRLVTIMVFTGKTDILYYGPIVDGLTTGLTVKWQLNDGELVYPKNKIKDHIDFFPTVTGGAALQADTDVPGTNDQAYIALVSGFGEGSKGFAMAPGESIGIEVADDFSGAAWLRHRFDVAGFRVKESMVRSASGSGTFVLSSV